MKRKCFIGCMSVCIMLAFIKPIYATQEEKLCPIALGQEATIMENSIYWETSEKNGKYGIADNTYFSSTQKVDGVAWLDKNGKLIRYFCLTYKQVEEVIPMPYRIPQNAEKTMLHISNQYTAIGWIEEKDVVLKQQKEEKQVESFVEGIKAPVHEWYD